MLPKGCGYLGKDAGDGPYLYSRLAEAYIDNDKFTLTEPVLHMKDNNS